MQQLRAMTEAEDDSAGGAAPTRKQLQGARACCTGLIGGCGGVEGVVKGCQSSAHHSNNCSVVKIAHQPQPQPPNPNPQTPPWQPPTS